MKKYVKKLDDYKSYARLVERKHIIQLSSTSSIEFK